MTVLWSGVLATWYTAFSVGSSLLLMAKKSASDVGDAPDRPCDPVNVISNCEALFMVRSVAILKSATVILKTSQSLLLLLATQIRSLAVTALTSRLNRSVILNAVCCTCRSCGYPAVL